MIHVSKTETVRPFVITIYVLCLVYATSLFVGFAAEANLLVLAALPLPLFPILGLHFLRTNERRAGWAGFTVWLGSTYAMSGEAAELIVFGLILCMALVGYFRQPALLAVAWFAHIAWDFMPRELPELLVELPTACMIFDGLIGIYLVGMLLTGKMRSALPPATGPAAAG